MSNYTCQTIILTFNLVIESFLFIFFKTSWKLESILGSNSSVTHKDNVGNDETLPISLTVENPEKFGVTFPNKAALLPLLEGWKYMIWKLYCVFYPWLIDIQIKQNYNLKFLTLTLFLVLWACLCLPPMFRETVLREF